MEKEFFLTFELHVVLLGEFYDGCVIRFHNAQKRQLCLESVPSKANSRGQRLVRSFLDRLPS
jgi:hypothetical protein